jgi:peroxiredoxin Q/BCP
MRLEPGQPAPPFTATDHEGNPVSLDDFSGENLVLYFYPKAFTPGCTTQACDFTERYETFARAGYQIAGVSPDKPQRLAKFREEYDVPYPMISDPDHVVAEAYGAWGTKKNYGKEYQGIIRSTIMIDPEGTVSNAWYNVRAKGHADKLVDTVVEAG